MNATVTIEKINAQQATLMLQNQHELQRGLKESWVNRLAAEMASGNFLLSCDALVLVNNVLYNGQHRLQAVIKANTTCQFLVMRTHDKEIFHVIDAGCKRNVSDVIGGEHRMCVAAMAMTILSYNQGMTSAYSRGGARLRRSEAIAFCEQHREKLVALAKLMHSFYKSNRFLSPSTSGAFAYLANEICGEDFGTTFIKSVYAGDTTNDAAKDLRDKLINNRLSKAKLPNTYLFGLIIKAFNCWMSNQRAKVLRLTQGEDYPAISTGK